ncbi:MAG: MBL fold metallo-hydrolase [Oscillospiraceae bacterium]|nr:MBL fold metallo-hydrolase [Oscillospiraceae bacterium]
MLRILPIASGSTGNCMLVDVDGRKIMIDLGVPVKTLLKTLSDNAYSCRDVDAVLITHTHSDHVKGLDVCMKQIDAPIYMSSTSKGTLMMEQAIALLYGEKSEILQGLWVTAIRTSHDCPGSIGFRIETEDTCLGYITDLGVIPESTMELLFGSQCIVIESNHDVEMLRYGKYPFFLKKRILSEKGHLSNDACSEAIARFAERGTKNFLLAHLSRENNRPDLALDCARKATAGMNVQIEVLPVYGENIIEVSE